MDFCIFRFSRQILFLFLNHHTQCINRDVVHTLARVLLLPKHREQPLPDCAWFRIIFFSFFKITEQKDDDDDDAVEDDEEEEENRRGQSWKQQQKRAKRAKEGAQSRKFVAKRLRVVDDAAIGSQQRHVSSYGT